MNSEPLDDLLEESAPPTRTIEPREVHAMMADAAAEAVPRRARHRTIGLGIAAAAALVVGGGGVAMATGLVAWPAGFEDPDGTYDFSLPSGRACEVRLIIEDPSVHADPTVETDSVADAETQRAVQVEVTRWLRDGGLERDLDLDAAEQQVKDIYEDQSLAGMSILIRDDGWLTDAAPGPGRPDADDARAFAVDRAVRTAMAEHLSEMGFTENGWTFSSEGGVKCAVE